MTFNEPNSSFFFKWLLLMKQSNDEKKHLWQWWTYTRLIHLFRTIITTSIAPNLVSLALGILALLLSGILGDFFTTTKGVIITISLFTLVCAVIVIISFFKLSPKEYAKLCLSGSRPSNTLKMVCYEIWCLNAQFIANSDNRALKKVIDRFSKFKEGSQNEIYELPEKDKIIITESRINGLDILHQKQERTIQNVIELLKQASYQLNIPYSRLCDYIYQFNPDIYSGRLQKYRSNWRELLGLIKIGPEYRDDKEIIARIEALLRSIKRIYTPKERRMWYQKQLLCFTSLHKYILDIASYVISTSSALKSYIAGLSYIDTIDKNDEKIKRFNFLYFKRRVHTGFDLHEACRNYWRKQNMEGIKMLKLLSKSGYFVNASDLTENEKMIAKEKAGLTYPKSLAEFYNHFQIQTYLSREHITDQFINWYRQKILNHTNLTPIIVVQGYSKTVRQVLRKGMPQLIPEGFPIPKIFILTNSQSRKGHFSNQLMTLEIKEPDEFKEKVRLNKIQVVSGNEAFLLGILDGNVKVVILLGAECFSGDSTDNYRIIHSAGMSRTLNDLKRKINLISSGDCEVVFVAEKYKRYDDLLQVPELYQDHFEHIDIYTKEHNITTVLTD